MIIMTIIFGPLQALVVRWFYLRGGGLFAELKSHYGNLANIKKDFPWLKPIFKKFLRRK